MKRDPLRTIAGASIALAVVLHAAGPAAAADATPSYPRMAALDQYLIADRNAEVALARSAAPEAISRDAEIMVLGAHGYEVAVKGKNGFVCIVERGWTAPKGDPDFWNPLGRAPVCLNAPAARSHLPFVYRRTELVLAGRSQDEMFAAVEAALDKKELPTVEPGAMCYMMSKHQQLSTREGHWHPHLMFFVPLTQAAAWGAGEPGSPVVAAFTDTPERQSVFLVPVDHWSDGTPDRTDVH